MQFSSLINGLARNIASKNGKKKADGGREAADALAKDARKSDLLSSSPGYVSVGGSDNFASVYSKRGRKGENQDSVIVWENFGCQEDMIFCGVFDGHGPWGHLISKRVRDSMPSTLLCYWQETLALSLYSGENLHQFSTWRQSYLKTCSAIDQELENHPVIDSFHSGTTALSIVRQGDVLIIANVGDSRAVMATTSSYGNLEPVQLTIDCKPNLPQEKERITRAKGKVFSSSDEPGVYRIWMPNGETPGGPGLALSRAFGDYFIKDFGLISEPEVTQRNITRDDQFVILATDGVWDVISNQEAIKIVSSAQNRETSAKRLVEHAVRAWKHKRRGIAIDDISAICLFLHPPPSSAKGEPLSCSKKLADSS